MLLLFLLVDNIGVHNPFSLGLDRVLSEDKLRVRRDLTKCLA